MPVNPRSWKRQEGPSPRAFGGAHQPAAPLLGDRDRDRPLEQLLRGSIPRTLPAGHLERDGGSGPRPLEQPCRPGEHQRIPSQGRAGCTRARGLRGAGWAPHLPPVQGSHLPTSVACHPAPPEPTAQANLDVDRPQPRARSPRSGRREDNGLRGQRAATAANEVDKPGSKLTADPGGSGWRGSQGCMTLRLKEVTGYKEETEQKS